MRRIHNSAVQGELDAGLCRFEDIIEHRARYTAERRRIASLKLFAPTDHGQGPIGNGESSIDQIGEQTFDDHTVSCIFGFPVYLDERRFLVSCDVATLCSGKNAVGVVSNLGEPFVSEWRGGSWYYQVADSGHRGPAEEMVDLSDDERDDVLHQLVRIVGTTNSMIAVLSEKVDALSERVDTLSDRVARLEGRMDALEGRMDALERRMDALERRMDALEGRMDALEGRMGALDERMTKLENTVALQQQNIDKLPHRIDVMERRQDNSSARLDVVDARLDLAEAQK